MVKLVAPSIAFKESKTTSKWHFKRDVISGHVVETSPGQIYTQCKRFIYNVETKTVSELSSGEICEICLGAMKIEG